MRLRLGRSAKLTYTWLPILLLVAAPTAAQETPVPPLSVDVSGSLGRRSLDAIERGAVRVEWNREGPRLYLDTLRLTPAAERSAVPASDSGCVLLSASDIGTPGRLGGSFFAFEHAPSAATAEISASSDGEDVLVFEYARAPRGFGGLSINLHNPEPLDDTLYYLDARSFETLSFDVRRAHGRERIAVRMSDADQNKRDEALGLGGLKDFIDSGTLTNAWQRAVISLDRLPRGIDRTRLAKLVLLPAEPGVGGIEITGLRLCEPGRNPHPDDPEPRLAGRPHEQRALWVWNTEELLANDQDMSEFLTFVRKQSIDTIYLQLPSVFMNPTTLFDPERDGSGVQNLLARLSRDGVNTLALDGAAEYALPENHEIVERTIRNVVRYNDAVGSTARFIGVHYDVEPYLLESYAGPRRSPILRGYLHLLERAQALSRSAALLFEVAIPFWFDSVVISPGREDDPAVLRLLSEQVLDRVDSVAIMDYRTTDEGPNGTVAHGLSELRYGTRHGQRVVIGLETTRLADSDVYRFYGAGVPGLPPVIGDRQWVVAIQNDGDTVMNLVSGDALQQLATTADAGSASSQTMRHWEVLVHVPVPASRVTFHDLGPSALHAVMDRTRAAARRYGAFGGIAIHEYRTYRRLLEVGDAEPPPPSPLESDTH